MSEFEWKPGEGEPVRLAAWTECPRCGHVIETSGVVPMTADVFRRHVAACGTDAEDAPRVPRS